MDYGNYGTYMGNGGPLSLDVSPTELKSISTYSGGGSYIGQGVQFSSVSPASQGGGSWYSPSDGNVHVLHTGEILRKVDQGN